MCPYAIGIKFESMLMYCPKMDGKVYGNDPVPDSCPQRGETIEWQKKPLNGKKTD